MRGGSLCHTIVVIERIRCSTEGVQVERLAHLLSLRLNASKSFCDLRVLIDGGLSVDEGVGSHPGQHFLLGLVVELNAADSDVLNLGKEVVPRLSHCLLVVHPSINELAVMVFVFPHLALPPFHDCSIIGISEGNGWALGIDELELTLFILLKDLFGHAGLWFGHGLGLIVVSDPRVVGILFLGCSDGNESGKSECVLHDL